MNNLGIVLKDIELGNIENRFSLKEALEIIDNTTFEEGEFVTINFVGEEPEASAEHALWDIDEAVNLSDIYPQEGRIIEGIHMIINDEETHMVYLFVPEEEGKQDYFNLACFV